MVRRFLLLNGVAILGVVLNHATGWGFVAMFWWTDRYLSVDVPNFAQMGSLSYFGLRAIEQLITFSIPAFLFVSGFFVATATRRSQETVEPRVIGMRVKNLVIPYLLWSLMYFTLDFAQGFTNSFSVYLKRLAIGGATDAFYFVPLLVQFYALSLLLVPLARKHWRVLLLATGLIQLGLRLLQYPAITNFELSIAEGLGGFTPAWFFPTHLFWFSFGIVVHFHLSSFKAGLYRMRWALLGGVLLLLPLGMVEWETLLRLSGEQWMAQKITALDDLYSAAFLLTFLAFSDVRIPYNGQLGELGARSYGIYLVHSLVLIVTAKLIYHLVPFVLSNQWIFQPIIISTGIAAPLLLMAAVSRSPARGFYRILFG